MSTDYYDSTELAMRYRAKIDNFVVIADEHKIFACEQWMNESADWARVAFCSEWEVSPPKGYEVNEECI